MRHIARSSPMRRLTALLAALAALGLAAAPIPATADDCNKQNKVGKKKPPCDPSGEDPM